MEGLFVLFPRCLVWFEKLLWKEKDKLHTVLGPKQTRCLVLVFGGDRGG